MNANSPEKVEIFGNQSYRETEESLKKSLAHNGELKTLSDEALKTFTVKGLDSQGKEETLMSAHAGDKGETILEIKKFTPEVQKCILDSIQDRQVFVIQSGAGRPADLKALCEGGDQKIKLSADLINQLTAAGGNQWANDYAHNQNRAKL